MIRAEQSREFFIEPVLGLGPSEHDGKHAHVIYRRSVEEGLGKNSTEPACGVTGTATVIHFSSIKYSSVIVIVTCSFLILFVFLLYLPIDR